MKLNLLSASIVAMAMASAAWADVTIVDENFDTYVDTAAMEAVWTPDLGQGDQPTAGPKGILVPELGMGLTPPYDDPPGLEGKGVNTLDNINEYNGLNAGQMANLVPTDTQSIQVIGDIFDDASTTPFGKRATIGLRNDTVQRGFGVFGTNFVEIGFYNATTFDPTDPDSVTGDLPSTGYGYRLALFGAVGGNLVRHPNWQYFPLDPSLDVAGVPSGDADFDTDGDRDGNDFLTWQRGNGLDNQTDNSNGDANADTVVDDVDLFIWKGQFGKAAGEEGDGLVSQVDIGEGWHRFSATITPTTVTLTLDLFRDGVVNLTRDTNGDIEVGVGEPGVDSTVTWEITPADDPNEPNPFDPFTSLRFGGPSGVSGNIESVVDNIKLALIDVTPPALASVPEPSSLGLSLLVLMGLAMARKPSHSVLSNSPNGTPRAAGG